MNLNVQAFRDEIRSVVNQETLDQSRWRSEKWKQLQPKLSEAILTDAYKQHEVVLSLFGSVGGITTRSCKSMARVAKKIDETANRGGEHFKVLSDLVAGRMNCDVSEIQSKIDQLRQIVKEKNGKIYVRGESPERPYGFFKKGNEFTDITQYVYIYLDTIGYPIELQIGHPFAAHTFAIDSALRDNPNCGLTDLWKDGFYGAVKQYILDRANSVGQPNKSAIVQKASELHKGNVPEELNAILAKL